MNRIELCDRAERYLDAMLAHDPARLELARSFRLTENGVERPLGDGLWRSVRSILTRRLFASAECQQVLISGVADDGQTAIFAIRLGFLADRLHEAEVLVTHKGESSIFAPESLTDRTPIAPHELHARGDGESLRGAVNAYFDGIERDSSTGVPFGPECNRIENGVQMTSNPAVLGGLGVAEQFDHKVFAYIEKVRGRRYPLVDTETGQVLAIGFLDVPGTVSSIELRGRRIELPPHVRKPRSTLLFEVFKVENGRIRAIEAFMHNLSYGATSGW